MNSATKKPRTRYLTPSEEKLLALVAAHDATGGIAASRRELSERLGCCLSTIDNALRSLRKKGLIRSKAIRSENGGQMANLYRLTAASRKKLPRLLGSQGAPADKLS